MSSAPLPSLAYVYVCVCMRNECNFKPLELQQMQEPMNTNYIIYTKIEFFRDSSYCKFRLYWIHYKLPFWNLVTKSIWWAHLELYKRTEISLTCKVQVIHLCRKCLNISDFTSSILTVNRGTQWICSSKYLFFRHIFAGWEMWKK